MEHERGVIKFAAIFLGYISYLLGGWDKTLEAMFIFMILDYATGYIKSLLCSKLSSAKAYEGLIKKSSYIFMVLIGASLDRVIIENHLNIPITVLGFPISFKAMMICSVIATEGISIAENLSEIKVVFPHYILNLFKKINDDKK